MTPQVYLFVMVSALYILLGWSVYLNFHLGQIYNGAFFTMGLGAYFTAWALREWGWPFELSLLVAIAIGGGIAFLLALKIARSTGLCVMVGSLCPLFIFQTVVRNLDFLGGPLGFFPIPSVEHLMPITLTAVSVIGFLIYRLDHSRLGRAMETLFDDPDVAATLGATTFRFSVIVQTAAGAMGALAGAIFAPLMMAIGPGDFSFILLLNTGVFIFVGGYTTMWGVVVFAPLLWALRVFLPTEITSWTMIMFGALLVGVMLLRPYGVISKQSLRSIRVNSQALLGRIRRLRKSGIG